MDFLKKRATLLVLILGISAPLFLQLGGRGLNEPDEGRYSEMGREMLVTKGWLIPRLNGVPHYAKPPWIYWCTAASFKLFGLNECAARLPSALAAAVTALTVFALGRRMAGEMAGLFSALILVTSFLFFACGRLITPDMMLTAFITLAFYCFWRWWESEQTSSRWLVGFYLAMGMGFFDKGPYGIVIPIAAVIPFLIWQKKAASIAKMGWIWGLLIVLGIALPWFIWMCRTNPDLYDFYLRGEIEGRITTGRGRSKVWWYFLATLPVACWPWTALMAQAGWHHVQCVRSSGKQAVASQFLICCFLLPFIVYNVVPSKLPTYILPVISPLALLTGIWMVRLTDRPQRFPAWATVATYLLLSCLPIALWVFFHRTLPQMNSFWMGLIALGLLGSALAWWLTTKLPTHPKNRLRFATWWLMTFLFVQAILFCTPRLETELRHNSSCRRLVDPISKLDLVGVPISEGLHPTGKKPSFTRAGPRVVMYEFFFRSSSFYLMKDKCEIVPLFGGDSIWENEKDKQAEAKPLRQDLIELLRGPETIFVITRPQYRKELQELTGMELPLIQSTSTGEDQAVLFSNQKRLGSENLEIKKSREKNS